MTAELIITAACAALSLVILARAGFVVWQQSKHAARGPETLRDYRGV